ncbi:MAG: aspartate-semialdehyde dehydrogenase [Deltaproteobacteria bacterium]|nr:aspartate-semialdehyde dehydrogenase [Deltaproteobacteria bacterium]
MQTVAIVGVTGAVGAELLAVLERRRYPVGRLVAMASARSVGTQVHFKGEPVSVIEARPEAFEGVDMAFFSAGASRSRDLAPAAVAAGALVVDNSSAFRMAPDVPLVVPEVNLSALAGHHGVVANPNCVAAILTVALAPLDRLAHINRLVIATYQSASGAGARAMEDLQVQTADYLAGRPVVARVLRHPFAFNLFSHDSAIEDNGYNGEENKVGNEIRKILGHPHMAISTTCVRVPVLRAHSAAVNIEFARAVSVEEARDALAAAPGLRLVDDRANNHFPMPNEASGADDVLVGRVRLDPSHPTGMNIFVAGDQLLKGAALNAVQIAEALTAAGAK